MDGTDYTTQYGYDKTGNRTSILYPTAEPLLRQGEVHFAYDAANRVSSVTTLVNGVATDVATDFAYEPFGPRTSMTFGNDLVDTRTYGTRYEMGAWTLGSLIDYTQAFNDDLDLTGRTDNLISSNSRTFGYDEAHRLVSAAGPWGAGNNCPGGLTYTYDANGNRTCIGEGAPATTYSYVANTNRLESTTDGIGTEDFTYDSNGNTLSDGDHTYEYSDANRLKSVDSGATATYLYDGENRRAKKTAFGNTTLFFFDPAGQLLTEIQPAFGTGKDYVFLGYEPIGRVDWSATETGIGNELTGDKADPDVALDWSTYSGGPATYLIHRKTYVDPNERTFDGNEVIGITTDPNRFFADAVLGDSNSYEYRVGRREVLDELRFYHSDALATPIAMTNGNSGLQWRAEHQPFGGIWSLSVSGVQSNLRFPGQYSDGETGRHYNYFRDYDPSIGRYIQSDPIGLAAGTNTYAYVGDNPIRFTDVLGLLTPEQCAAAKRLLAREEMYGTVLAARMSSITFGDQAAGSFNTDRAAPIPTRIGPFIIPVELDWYIDVRASTPPFRENVAPIAYIVGKLWWTKIRIDQGIPITHALPFQDPGETGAVAAVQARKSFRDIFNKEYMARECPSGCGDE